MRISALAPRSLRLAGRYLFALICSLTLLFVFSSRVSAQIKTVPTPSIQSASNTNPDVPNNLHNWTQNVLIEVMSALTCQIAGVDPVNPKQACLGVDQKTGKIGYVQSGGGAIGVVDNMISVLYTPPAHTKDYFQNLAANFGFPKKAYAQTTGFQGLKPLMGLWITFRNIVYIIFVIIFIIIGLAIMLRIKIDPRTVMTIQNQIPKIIIGLLLVTFSFAIAGFLIDLMYVFIYFIWGTVSSAAPGIEGLTKFSPASLQGQSPLGGVLGFGDIHKFAANIAGPSSEIIRKMLNITTDPSAYLKNPITDIAQIFISSSFSGIVPGPNFADSVINFLSLGTAIIGVLRVLTLATPAAFGASAGFWENAPFAIPFGTAVYETMQAALRYALPFALVYIIIFVALLFALFRLWFTLLMAYVYILLDVVFAPFWIIAGALPGSPISFTGWLRDLGANLLAFPATIAMFLLGKVLMANFAPTPPAAQPSNPFVPPLIGNANDPNLFGALIGIGIILMTPNVVTMLKAALKAPKIEAGGVGQLIGAGAALPLNVGRTIGGIFVSQEEVVMQDTGGIGDDKYKWGRRGPGRAILGRILGGR